MKKLLTVALVLLVALTVVACTADEPAKTTTAATTTAPTTTAPTTTEDINAKSEGVLTYEQYVAAEMDTEVVIEAYIQATQVYSEQYGNTSIYAQDGQGAYFIYRYACTAEDYAKLTKGAKIRVTGTKTAWSGEVEIADVTKLEIIEGNYVAPVTDVTELLGKEELINKQNMLGSFKNLTVAASKIQDDATEYAFLYNWDGSGTDGSDIYFNVTDGTNVYTFVVETDLCPATSDVYAAVKALKVGDKINVEGFLYWYNGIQLHTTSVAAAQ